MSLFSLQNITEIRGFFQAMRFKIGGELSKNFIVQKSGLGTPCHYWAMHSGHSNSNQT